MKINIASNEIIHFIGIGGIGMSGLAQIMKNMGFAVQGSDLNAGKNTDRLIKSGIKVYGDTVHVFFERNNYQGVFLPGFEKWQSDYSPTSC